MIWVLHIVSVPESLHNHAQPEPNLVNAAALNLDLNSSNEPKASLIASISAPLGLKTDQEGTSNPRKAVVPYPPPLFLTVDYQHI